MKENSIHTFVICAYKEQPYLDECVKSLKNQTLKSKIIISTSTPNDFIKSVAKKYSVDLAINTKTKGHINDFCFAYDQANTKYVTLCHQDDIYYPDFAEKMVNKMEKFKNPIIGFSNYNERRNGKTKKHNMLLILKRIINFPISIFKKSKKVRLFTLSVGNAICAPSVTYNKEKVKRPIDESELKSNIDWDTWINLAKKDGEFIYITKALLEHRIHEGSTTTSVINNNIKNEEDFMMFSRFWPKGIARFLTRLYSGSEKSNDLKEEKQKGKVDRMKIFLVALYLILTVSGLILYKYGANKDFTFSIAKGNLNLKLNIISIIGLLCYMCSFLLYMLILPKFNISFIMPLTSAVTYISTFILSIMILKETVTANGIIGAIVILVGIVIMNMRS